MRNPNRPKADSLLEGDTEDTSRHVTASPASGPVLLDNRLALRPREAAEALGVSPRTLRKWMRDLGLPYSRVEGVVLIPIRGLESWLEERSENERRTDKLAQEVLEGF